MCLELLTFTLFKTCCCCCFWVCVFSPPIFLSLPPPNVPPLPIFWLLPIFFSQNLHWSDWKPVWWRTLETPPMKRKTTQSPKPQGQVTLGQFSLPPHPQAGHRAIAALLHHPLVLKHSHSHSLCLFGWHPKTGKLPQCFLLSLKGCLPKLSLFFSIIHHPFITGRTLNSRYWLRNCFSGYKWTY